MAAGDTDTMVKSSPSVIAVAEQLRESDMAGSRKSSTSTSSSSSSGHAAHSTHASGSMDRMSGRPYEKVVSPPGTRSKQPPFSYDSDMPPPMPGTTTITLGSPNGSPSASLNRAHSVMHHDQPSSSARPVERSRAATTTASTSQHALRGMENGYRGHSGHSNGGRGSDRDKSYHNQMPNGHSVNEQPKKVRTGALNCALLPSFDKLSRTRHGCIPLDSRANTLRQAEQMSPGICDAFVEELVKRVAHPQANSNDIQNALRKLMNPSS